MRLPSGERDGRVSADIPSPIGTAVPPAVGASHTRSFHSNAKYEPSGDTDGFTPKRICDQSPSPFGAATACASVEATTHAATSMFFGGIL